MTASYYIALDIETGGIEVEHTLLTAFFLVLDKQFNELAELYLYIKPDGGKPYVMDAEGMAVNKINIVEHDKIAIAASKAGQELYKFLKDWSGDGKIKLIPIGHGITFDLNHIWHNLLRRKTFEQFTSYRKIDTSSVAQFMKACGQFPEHVSGSLESLVNYFQLTDVKNYHNAADDTRATVAVLKELIKLENGIPKIDSPHQ